MTHWNSYKLQFLCIRLNPSLSSSCKDVLYEAKVTEFLTHLAFWSLNLYRFLNATAFITDRYMTVLREKHIFEHVQWLYWSPSMHKPPTLVSLDRHNPGPWPVLYKLVQNLLLSMSAFPTCPHCFLQWFPLSLPFLLKYFSKQSENKENC